MAEITMPISGAMRGVTIKVRLTGRRRMAARLWIGALLVRAAAKVIGCIVELDTRTDEQRGAMLGAGATPLRLSVDDPDYDWRLGRNLRVMVDGVEVTDVVSFDVEQATVVRLVRSAAGRFIVDPKHERAERETLLGEVAVTWVDRTD